MSLSQKNGIKRLNGGRVGEGRRRGEKNIRLRRVIDKIRRCGGARAATGESSHVGQATVALFKSGGTER